MRNCDIKFVNKEINLLVVFPCSSKCLNNAILKSMLCKVVYLFKVPTVVTNRFS